MPATVLGAGDAMGNMVDEVFVSWSLNHTVVTF